MKTPIAIVVALSALLASVTASAANTNHEVYALMPSSPTVTMGNGLIAATSPIEDTSCYTTTLPATVPVISGEAILIWDETDPNNPNTVVEAFATFKNGATAWIFLDPSCYNLTLVPVSVGPDHISGCYQIWENGNYKDTVEGDFYNLDSQSGSYFKFYDVNGKAHFSDYVTDRFDS